MAWQSNSAAGGVAEAGRSVRLLPLYVFVQRACEHPALPAFAVALAMLLTTPALTTGLLADDFVHQLILSGSNELPAYHQPWFRLFQFASPEVNRSLLHDGVLPWWADLNLNFAFFRPLSALTHRLDFALWPHSPPLMHAHSMLWAAVLLVAVGMLYRQLFRLPWMAALAMLFYALDATRAVTIAWIANRNSLIACALSVFSLVVYLRGLGESGGSRTARWASPALFAAALLSSEGGFGVAGYLLAAALFLDQGPLVRRLSKLAPHALVGIAILGTSRWLGFGVMGSGVYFDPLRDAPHYLAALPGRALAMIAASLGGPSADASNAYDLVFPGLAIAMAIFNLLAVIFWISVLGPLVRRSPTARFAATGALLALLPSAAAYASDRLLGWVAVGVMALLVEFFASFLSGSAGQARRFALAAFFIVLIRLFVSPAALLAQCINENRVHQLLERTNQAIPWSEQVRSQTVVYVNPPQDPFVAFVPPLRAATGVPRPAAQRWLATGLSAVAVRRTGERTLEVIQEDGFLRQHTEQTVRSTDNPLRTGDKVDLPEFTVQITRTTSDQRPAEARFEFKQPLTAPNLLWLAFRDGKYVPFTPPPVGECVVLPANDLLALMLGNDNPFAQFFAGHRANLNQASPNLCTSSPRM